jgi:hypothetical protein
MSRAGRAALGRVIMFMVRYPFKLHAATLMPELTVNKTETRQGSKSQRLNGPRPVSRRKWLLSSHPTHRARG